VVPPVIVKFAVPTVDEQFAKVPNTVPDNTAGCVTDTANVPVHTLLSVTVTVYVPDARPDKSSVMG
jgi:hypothetical protein